MKKIILVIVTVILLTVIAQIVFSNRDYPVGKDTVVQIGNGRFDVDKVIDGYTVFDLKTGDEIEPSVKKYSLNPLSGKLYLIGSKGYTLIHYKGEGAIEQHESLEKFDKSCQESFKHQLFISPKWTAAVDIICWLIYLLIVSAVVLGGHYLFKKVRYSRLTNN